MAKSRLRNLAISLVSLVSTAGLTSCGPQIGEMDIMPDLNLPHVGEESLSVDVGVSFFGDSSSSRNQKPSSLSNNSHYQKIEEWYKGKMTHSRTIDTRTNQPVYEVIWNPKTQRYQVTTDNLPKSN